MIRPATADDLPLVQELWRAFDAEVPDSEWHDDDSEQDLAALEKAIGEDVVLLDDDVGLAVATRRGSRLGFLDIVYVKPEARGNGIAAGLVREAARRLAEQGAEMVELEVLHSNDHARGIYEHWGFAPVEHVLAARIDRLVQRLDPSAHGPTFGSVHVQTDDTGAVERAARKFLPRFGHSSGPTVTGPANGWVRIRDDLADRDPDVLHQLAKELSYTSESVVLALGVEEGALVRYTLYDRGTTMDEYWSLPEFRGPLPPGDVIALSANPRVVARLTGADAAQVRRVARTARGADELPAAAELHAQIAALMGVEV